MTDLRLDPAFLAKLEGLRLSVRRFRWGSRVGGRFVINRRGSSIEFDDYSPYTPGDDIRAIDWNLYARSDRLYVRTYKEEVELSVEVMLDATRSMGLPTPDKFQRTCEIGLCLAYVALARGHRVRLSWIRPGAITATPWMAHRSDIARLTQQCAQVRPDGAQTLSAWMQRAVPALRIRGGQAILLSDWMMPPAECFQALQLLRRRHAELKVLQVLSPQELDPAKLLRSGVVVDSETGMTHELAYSPAELASAVIDHNEQLARFCKRHDILFAQHRLDESLAELVLRRLPACGVLEPVR